MRFALPVTPSSLLRLEELRVAAADLAGVAAPVLTAEQGELLARVSEEVGAAVRERGR